MKILGMIVSGLGLGIIIINDWRIAIGVAVFVFGREIVNEQYLINPSKKV